MVGSPHSDDPPNQDNSTGSSAIKLRPGKGFSGSHAVNSATWADASGGNTEKSVTSDETATPTSTHPPTPPAQQAIADSEGYFTPKPQHYPLPAFSSSTSNSSLQSSPVPTNTTKSIGTTNTTFTPPTEGSGLSLVDSDAQHRLRDSNITVTALSSEHLAFFTTSPREPTHYLEYPNQAYAALHSQHYPAPHQPPLQQPYPVRTPSSHAADTLSQSTTLWQQPGPHRARNEQSSKTAGNTPSSSPGLFAVQRPPIKTVWDEQGSYSSPYLHWTQRQAPKETHVADIDKDPISGRKLINQYEVIDELGRGSHGKVKLARSLETGEYVAIKIVERFSKKRRLGRLGNPEEKVKKEVAILKKAHHPNVVRLEEVIDDPTDKKVYIVLEFVEKGEVVWRRRGPKEIVLLEQRRQEREARGIIDDPEAANEDQQIFKEATKRRLRMERRRRRLKRSAPDSEYWSIEYGGVTEEDQSDEDNASRVSSVARKDAPEDYDRPKHHAAEDLRDTSRTSTPLSSRREVQHHDLGVESEAASQRSTFPESTKMKYRPDQATAVADWARHAAEPVERVRGRTPSVAASTVSQITEILENPLQEDLNYVPTLTLAAARAAFRDAVLGLEYLHFQGIIHRDMKPSNLLLDHNHRTKISDFGVSYLGKPKGEGGDSEDLSESEAKQLDEAVELAKTVGTPAFFAPELCLMDCDEDHSNWPVTDAIDIWALGATLFCLIFGRIPFVAENEFAVMKRISTEEAFIPRRRLKAVEIHPSSRPTSHGRAMSMLDHRKRGEYELVYEEIDDDLHDLLRRFFTKDPRRRITLKEVKHHPWLLQGISNPGAWLETTDPSHQSHGKKIEVSREDVQKAVVSMNIIERMRSGIRRIGGALGIGKSNPSRYRARSNTKLPETSQPQSAGSSGSATSTQDRRRSLRADEIIFSALKALREGEHPLSQSVSVSPEIRERDEYLHHEASRSTSTVDSLPLLDTRPVSRAPTLERAQSNVSTTGSIKTVRQSDFRSRDADIASPPLSPGLPGTPKALDTPGESGLGGMLGGAGRRILKNMRNRERGSGRGGERLDFEAMITDIPRGEPSVAVSNAVAAGHVNPPDIHKIMSPPSSLVSSPAADRTEPAKDLPENIVEDRRRSIASVASSSTGSPSAASIYPHFGLVSASSEFPRESIDDQFLRAQDEMFGRRNLARLQQEEKHDRESSRPRAASQSSSADACPPSPDDDIFLQVKQTRTTSRPRSRLDGIEEAPSPPTTTLPPPSTLPIPSSSSEERFASDLSPSTSYPSMPSISAISSAPPDDPSTPPKGALGTPSPSETILPSSRGSSGPPTTHRLSEDDEGYSGDRDRGADRAIRSDSDSDGDDDFIVMTRHSSAKERAAGSGSGSGRNNSFSARMERRKRREAESVGEGNGSGSGNGKRERDRERSWEKGGSGSGSEGGSGGTLTKVRTKGEDDETV